MGEKNLKKIRGAFAKAVSPAFLGSLFLILYNFFVTSTNYFIILFSIMIAMSGFLLFFASIFIIFGELANEKNSFFNFVEWGSFFGALICLATSIIFLTIGGFTKLFFG